MTSGWKCGNCGHITDEATETLEELNVQIYDGLTSKTSCPNCGTYTIQRVTELDYFGNPIAGYFLIVKTKNRIKKGR